jgi:hypothetical protein
MWFWRRMLNVSRTDTIPDEDIRKQANEKRRTVVESRKGQSI